MESDPNPMVEGETVEHVWVTSPGITGDGDASKLESSLDALDGVNEVHVDPGAHTVEVVYDPRVVSFPLIQEQIISGGYKIDDVRYGAQRDADEPSGSAAPGATPSSSS